MHMHQKLVKIQYKNYYHMVTKMKKIEIKEGEIKWQE